MEKNTEVPTMESNYVLPEYMNEFNCSWMQEKVFFIRGLKALPIHNLAKGPFNIELLKKSLNLRIMRITMLIRDKYPELSKYIEEMPVTIPIDSEPEITLKNLKAYLDSLSTMLNRYKAEQALKVK